MLFSCIKKWIGVLLLGAGSIYGVEMPAEEGLSVSQLENGVQIWLQEHPYPSQMISCRVVMKNPLEEVPQVFPLDCPLKDFEEELPCLIDSCLESIYNEPVSRMAVVAVGDFDKKMLGELLAAAFEVFSSRQQIVATPLVSVVPAADADMVYLSLYYPTTFQELRTDQDLRKLWILYMLQSIATERFRKVADEVEGQWIQPTYAKYLLPYSYCTARGKQLPQHDPSGMLQGFLLAMQELKRNGFTELELSEAKARLQKNLFSFYQQNPVNTTLADYYASHFAFGAGCPSYTIFMTMSIHLISTITMQDVGELLREYFKDDARRVKMTVPLGVAVASASIQETLESLKTDDLVLNKEEAQVKGQLQYSQLPLAAEEAQLIYDIIDTVGKTLWINLAFKRAELAQMGAQVQHVHPFRFLEVIFTDQHLKQRMGEIADNIFKMDGFMNGSGSTAGFGAKMEREYKRENLFPYLVSFCQAVKANPDQIRPFIERKQWDKLVKYLIKLEN